MQNAYKKMREVAKRPMDAAFLTILLSEYKTIFMNKSKQFLRKFRCVCHDINQHNHDNATGLVEYQNILDDGYKLCIAQNKEEINFLKQQIKNLTEILKHK